MPRRVLARLVVGCTAAAGAFALALVHPGEQPAPLAVAYSDGPVHVDPLPPGTSMSDPVDTAALYERAGLSRRAVRAYRTAPAGSAASVPPGDPSVRGLDRHVRPSCSGTGADGLRVQVLYVRESGTESRYHELLPLIRNEIATVDDVFAVSSRKTGGDLRVRWVHDDCVPVVEDVSVPAGTLDYGMDRLIEELGRQGYADRSRKYLAFADARRLCGVGTYWLDDSAHGNANDGYGAAYSRVDAPCWSGSTSTPAHELMHNLGAVQLSAPNSTRFGHCTDEADLMCYDDGSGDDLRSVCSPGHDQLFDCRGDDYFNTAPAAGTYLAAHWNTAGSGFLDPAPDQQRSGPASQWSAVTERGHRRAHLAAVLRDAHHQTPLASQPVLLERRAPAEGRWTRVTTGLATDGSGVVSVRVPRRSAGWYRFVHPGSADRDGSSSEAVLVEAGSQVRAGWRGRGNRVVGRLVDLRGRPVAGKELLLQQRHPGSGWHTVGQRTTNRRGWVRARQRVQRTTYFRWVFRGDATLLADRSPRVRARR